MPAAPLPPNETQRLEALRDYSIMHTSPERDFDEIASMAARICGVPRALIGFLDASQEWLKAGVGFACGASPREESFCQYLIAQPAPLLEIPDATEDVRFREHPSVLGEPNIRFYAGVQVRAPGGEAVGTLCVIDSHPRPALEPSQRESLLALSRQITTLLELRKSVAKLQKAMEEQHWYTEQLESYQKKLEEANITLERQSTHDMLTGLSNRRAFDKRVEDEAIRSRRYDFPLSLLMLDADQFKAYNDSYGHPAGDEVLRTIAAKLRSAARASDLVARYGGEEFVVILPQTGPEGATIIAERIRLSIESASWPQRPVTVSIGSATLSGRACDENVLLKAADVALYEAKRDGRNRVRSAPQQ